MAKTSHNPRFADVLSLEGTGATRTVISARDGIAEYFGAELGLEPADRVFTVYRPPHIIANVAARMVGIPVVNDHAMVDGDAKIGAEGGRVESSEMVDMRDDLYRSTMAIKNAVTLTPDLIAEVESGKRQLSVDGTWELVPGKGGADFEVAEAVPEHLAITSAARLGPSMRFLDSKPTKEHHMKKFSDSAKKLGARLKALFADKKFADEDGGLTLQGLIETLAGLTEMIKDVDISKLPDLQPHVTAMLEVIKGAGGKQADEKHEEPDGDEGKQADAACSCDKSADSDKDGKCDNCGGAMPKQADAEEEKEKKFGDAVTKAVKAAIETERKTFADAQAFRDLAIAKGRDILDTTYDFTGKTGEQIARDVLAKTNPGEKFADAELATALKLAKKFTDYSQFGKGADDEWNKTAEKEI